MVDQLALGEEDVAHWLRGARGMRAPQAIDSVTRLPGDASTRRYYRISSGQKTYIVMKMEEFSSQGDQLPFLVMQKHLIEAGVDVPRVFDCDPSRGFILLEDLGDATLLRKLQDCSSDDIERHHFERVIDGLVHLQVYASPERKPAQIDAFKLRFDREKLMWEMNFTVEHFYELYLKRKITDAHRRVMLEGLGEICETLAHEPMVLTHRDFHSRNIMASGDRLVMIDFQDARLGCAQYDLASLLKDSYYQLEEAQIQRLVDYYIARYEAVSQKNLDRSRFFEVFDLMGVQRNFKAIGSFASFLNRRGDATYLKFIGNTFENIRRALLKYPRYAALREVLFHYYYF